MQITPQNSKRFLCDLIVDKQLKDVWCILTTGRHPRSKYINIYISCQGHAIRGPQGRANNEKRQFSSKAVWKCLHLLFLTLPVTDLNCTISVNGFQRDQQSIQLISFFPVKLLNQFHEQTKQSLKVLYILKNS